MSIAIGPLIYEEEQHHHLVSLTGEKLHGQVEHDSCIITYQADQSDRMRFAARWHEVLHIIDVLYSINLDEDQVTCLASAIAAAVIQNKSLNWNEERNS